MMSSVKFENRHSEMVQLLFNLLVETKLMRIVSCVAYEAVLFSVRTCLRNMYGNAVFLKKDALTQPAPRVQTSDEEERFLLILDVHSRRSLLKTLICTVLQPRLFSTVTYSEFRPRSLTSCRILRV